MSLVIDGSAIVPLALGDEDAAYSNAVLAYISRNAPALVPPLLLVRSGRLLAVSERRGRISPSVVDEFLVRIRGSIPIRVSASPDAASLLNLARRSGLTAYDAAYLELTLRANSQLASHDAALRAAVQQEGGQLFNF